MTLPNGFSVERANWGELDRVFDLRWRVLRQPSGEPRGSEQDEFDYSDRAVHGVAVLNGIIHTAGRIHRSTEGDFWQVRYMATDPEFRGRGLGSAVLAFLEGEAMRLDVCPLEIRANVRADAATLYERAGYVDMLIEPTVEHGVQHFMMHKIVREV